MAFVVRSDDGCIDVVDESGHTVTVPVGGYPSALVRNRDGTRAYVTNHQDGSVSVIDTAPASPSRNTVVATLDVGGYWCTGVILSRDGSRAYAVNDTDACLSVIDTAPDSATRDGIVGQIDLRRPPAALGLSPNGRWIYTINHFDNVVWAVHTVTNTLAPIPVPGYPYRLSFSPNGLRVYASLTDNGSMSVIDTDPTSVTYHSVIARLRLGGHVPDPVFTIAGARAYVPAYGADLVYVIDTASGAAKRIAVGRYPWDVAVSQDGLRAYIANCLDDSVSIVDSASDTVTATVAVGARPCRIALSADGSQALVANNRDNSVSVIDTATALVSSTILVGRNPFDVTLSRDGARGCVHHRDGMSVLSLRTTD
jgi:YVTN family beta-propeller protein